MDNIEERMANVLDVMVDTAFEEAISKGTSNFLSNCINEFRKKYHKHEVSLSKTINTVIYHWYFGNFANKIVCLVFQPSLFLDAPEKEKYSICLNSVQVADVLNVCFNLIAYEEMKIDIKDYYGQTPYWGLRHTLGYLYEEMPLHIRAAAHPFLMLFKRGKDIVLMQQNCVRQWLTRRKNAIQRIEEWWFEIVNDPDTRPGKRILNKRAEEWKRKYCV
jgi:hypothetical protein